MKLKQLISKITGLGDFSTVETLNDLITDCTINNFNEYSKFSSKTYCKNKLYYNNHFEIVLICWNPHQETPKHGHPENGCIMKVLQGELIETRTIGHFEKKTKLRAGDVAFISKKDTHIIENGNTQSISLHIYSPSGYYDAVSE